MQVSTILVLTSVRSLKRKYSNSRNIGVLREYSFDRLKDSDQQWIRDVYFFDECHFLIICCTYAQAKAFTNVQCIEMDLSFKMVQGKTNVFSISAWNAEAKSKFTYIMIDVLVVCTIAALN